MFSAHSHRTANAYQRINVETSMHTIDQHQLVSLLLDGVLSAVATARGALARGDISTKCASISKAVRILEEGLITALDLEQGGEVASRAIGHVDPPSVQCSAGVDRLQGALPLPQVILTIRRDLGDLSAGTV